MSELNRPETPGPWRSREEAPGSGSRVMVIDPWHIRLVCDAMPQAEQDSRAIADLPEWIEAHDEWKARAEKAEAQLGELTALLDMTRAHRDEYEARAEKAEAALEGALKILNNSKYLMQTRAFSARALIRARGYGAAE